MSENEKNKEQKTKEGSPDLSKIIKENPQDITPHLWDLFGSPDFKSDIEEELKEDAKNQKRSSRS